MTANRLTGEARPPDPPAAELAPAPAGGVVLALCDAVLGEVGRRHHLFGWLRDPQAGPQQWLAVDAYYPGHRLVVMYREPGAVHERLYVELIPSHGLRLLVIDPAELEDEDGPQAVIEELIAELGELRPPPPAGPADEPRASVVARAVTTFSQPLVRPPAPALAPAGGPRAAAAERGARFVASRQPPGSPPRAARATPLARRPPPPARRRAQAPAPLPAPSLVVGLGLAAILCAEIYLGVVGLVLSGTLLLAFGLALDACARALGTIAAARTGRQDWAWLCVIGGSPAVAAFALFHPSGPVDLEPAPLAGLLSLIAGGVILVALIAAALGI